MWENVCQILKSEKTQLAIFSNDNSDPQKSSSHSSNNHLSVFPEDKQFTPVHSRNVSCGFPTLMQIKKDGRRMGAR